MWLTAALSAGAALGVYASAIEPQRLTVTRAAFRLDRLPATLDGLRAVLISDIHVAWPHMRLARVRRLVQRVNALRPDLVLMLGDYVTRDLYPARFVPPEQAITPLAELRAPLGCFAVIGDHDAEDWPDGAARVEAALASAGIRVLNDTAHKVKENFYLAGIRDYDALSGDVGAALAEVPADAESILLSHTPDAFPHVPAHVGLSLCGHTHGGQIRLPGIGAVLTMTRIGRRYAYGFAQDDGRHLFTTRGLGTSALPLRFLCPPELVELTLRAGAPHGPLDPVTR